MQTRKSEKRFHKEASVWVELGRHPYLVHAYFVDEVSGRLYIVMEYIAPNEEGLNSLEGYLQRRPPDLAQSLRWAIQICHGMEYAYSKGVRAHRDLKPANIMISQDKTAKITDFGLAGVISESPALRPICQFGDRSFRTDDARGAGLAPPPTWPRSSLTMPPGAMSAATSTALGVVLYQMAAGGRLPFPVPMNADWQVMQAPAPRVACAAAGFTLVSHHPALPGEVAGEEIPRPSKRYGKTWSRCCSVRPGK